MRVFAWSGTELTLHIGTGKAGSTSIQNHIGALQNQPLLPRSLEALLGRKVMSIRSFGLPNAINLTAACGGTRAHRYFVTKRQRFSQKQFDSLGSAVWENADKEIAESPFRRFVASSEFLGAFLGPDETERLKHCLDKLFDRVQIVVYLRDQRSFLPSLWAQEVNGPTNSGRSFPAFMETLEDRRHLWDYSIFLKTWREVFGPEALDVTVFDPAALYEGDVVADFFRKAGARRTPVQLTEAKANVSPSWRELEKIRLGNILKRDPNRDLNLEKCDLEAEIEASKDLILKKVAKSNQWINETFLKRSKVYLPTSETQ